MLAFACPLPGDTEIDKYYSQGAYTADLKPNSPAFKDFSRMLNNSRLRLIEKFLPADVRMKCLDVGAGNAVFGQVLKDRLTNGNYDAVEPDESTRAGWGAWVDRAYEDSRQAAMNHYTLLVMNQVLEHVNTPVAFLKFNSEKLIDEGLMYIDVPYRDDLYKTDITPHLLFWNIKSLSEAVTSAGLEVLFCDSAGMPRKMARQYFKPAVFPEKFFNLWRWKGFVKRLLGRSKIGFRFNEYAHFEVDQSGGQRQWLRCVARKNGWKS